ncbi:methyl-accepting chemotaxis protein, partial [Antarcticirhabdus aurantiaca]
MSIKFKLIAGFALLLVLNGLAAAVGLSNLKASQDSFVAFSSETVNNQLELKTVRAYISDVGRLVNMLDVIEDDAKFTDYSQTATERAAKALDLVTGLEARVDADQRPALQDLAAALRDYGAKAQTAVDLYTAAHKGSDPSALAKASAIARDQLAPAMSAMVDMISTATDAQEAAAAAAIADKQAAYESAWWQMLGICVLTLVIGGSAGWAVTRRIGQGLGFVQFCMKTIGDGDIAEPIVVHAKDEIGDVLHAMNGMTERLRQVVGAVRLSSSQVASGSALSAQTAEQLSSGSTEQAAASEQASAAVEEMTANVRQNADNAAQTEKIAAQANVNAEKTGTAVAQSVEAMRTIAEKIT